MTVTQAQAICPDLTIRAVDEALLARAQNDLLELFQTVSPIVEVEGSGLFFIDTRGLPAPMRLPALLSAGWQHQSEWSAWPFEITA